MRRALVQPWDFSKDNETPRPERPVPRITYGVPRGLCTSQRGAWGKALPPLAAVRQAPFGFGFRVSVTVRLVLPFALVK